SGAFWGPFAALGVLHWPKATWRPEPRGSGKAASPTVHAGLRRMVLHWTIPHREDVMRVAELMQPKVKPVGSDATVAEAIVSLADAHISGMPVVDGAGKVIGIVSAHDLLTAEGGDRYHGA